MLASTGVVSIQAWGTAQGLRPDAISALKSATHPHNLVSKLIGASSSLPVESSPLKASRIETIST
jgi:hypothetical protein